MPAKPDAGVHLRHAANGKFGRIHGTSPVRTSTPTEPNCPRPGDGAGALIPINPRTPFSCPASNPNERSIHAVWSRRGLGWLSPRTKPTTAGSGARRLRPSREHQLANSTSPTSLPAPTTSSGARRPSRSGDDPKGAGAGPWPSRRRPGGRLLSASYDGFTSRNPNRHPRARLTLPSPPNGRDGEPHNHPNNASSRVHGPPWVICARAQSSCATPFKGALFPCPANKRR